VRERRDDPLLASRACDGPPGKLIRELPMLGARQVKVHLGSKVAS